MTADTDVFDLLANSRRRQVLRYLDNKGAAPLREVAEVVAAGEEDRPVEDLAQEEIRRVYISLYQTHLPRLETADLVDVNVDEYYQIKLTDKADVPLAYLKFSPEENAGDSLSTARKFVRSDSA